MLNCILALINYYRLKKYKILNVISKNNKSEILLVKYKKKNYSMKIFNNIKRASREIKILNVMNKKQNEYFLKYINSFRCYDNIYVITNYFPEGDLLTFINSFDNLSYFMIKNIIYKMLIPIYYLHVNKYVHLDIKFDNYLFKSNYNDFDLILIDYESCHKLRSNINYLDYSVGTHDYCAPETFNNYIYGSYSDVWSIGICLLKLLIGDEIIFNKNKKYKIVDIKKNLEKVEKNHPKFYVRLLQDILNKSFVNRIDLLELIYFLELDLKKDINFVPVKINYND
jgi:serine/threonine protein kinase